MKPEFLIWQALWVLPFHWPGIYLELRDSQIPDFPLWGSVKGNYCKKDSFERKLLFKRRWWEKKRGEKNTYSVLSNWKHPIRVPGSASEISQIVKSWRGWRRACNPHECEGSVPGEVNGTKWPTSNEWDEAWEGLGRTAMGCKPMRWAPGSEILFPPADPCQSWALRCWPKGSDCQTRSADTAQYGVTQSESAEEELLMHTSHVNAQTNTPSTHECREQLKTFTVMYLDIMNG